MFQTWVPESSSGKAVVTELLLLLHNARHGILGRANACSNLEDKSCRHSNIIWWEVWKEHSHNKCWYHYNIIMLLLICIMSIIVIILLPLCMYMLIQCEVCWSLTKRDSDVNGVGICWNVVTFFFLRSCFESMIRTSSNVARSPMPCADGIIFWRTTKPLRRLKSGFTLVSSLGHLQNTPS